MDEARTAAEISELTPNQAWEIYIGSDSTRDYTPNDLARYVASAPTCEGLTWLARHTLLSHLSVHRDKIARGSKEVQT